MLGRLACLLACPPARADARVDQGDDARVGQGALSQGADTRVGQVVQPVRVVKESHPFQGGCLLYGHILIINWRLLLIEYIR